MKRLIFTLLYKNGFFYLSRNFRLQKIGDINWLFSNYKFNEVSRALDEIMILNVSRNIIEDNLFLKIINQIAEKCFVPITVGGCINSLEVAKNYMNNGADKLLINTAIYENIDLVHKLVNNYGKQCIIGSIDFMESKNEKNKILVMTDKGSKKINQDLYDWIEYLVQNQIGEILLQSIDNDGTGNGLYSNLDFIKLSKVEIPIIMMGGIGNFEQIFDGFDRKYINAVSTANILNFIGNSFSKNRNFLIKKNILLPEWSLDNFNKLENIFSENK